MLKVRYVNGDATQPESPGMKYIAHVVNDENLWGSGFVLGVSRRWPETKTRYHAWMKRNQGRPMLGALQLVPVEPDIIIANIVGQHGIRRSPHQAAPVRYDALARGFTTLAAHILAHTPQASLHSPMLGCGRAGGRWEHIEPLLRQHFLYVGIPVTVYRLPG